MDQTHLHCRSVAPSKRFPNKEFLLRATNLDAFNKQTDNSVGRLSKKGAHSTEKLLMLPADVICEK